MNLQPHQTDTIAAFGHTAEQYAASIGEIYDSNWKSKLLKRNFTTNSLDEQKPDFGWGSKVDEYFSTPH